MLLSHPTFLRLQRLRRAVTTRLESWHIPGLVDKFISPPRREKRVAKRAIGSAKSGCSGSSITCPQPKA